MNEPIIIIDTDGSNRNELCNLLKAHHYHPIASASLSDLPGLIQRRSCRAVILDLDTVPVENRYLRGLKKEHPSLYIVAVSDRPFHPELKEAMTTYIYACLCKPIDPDELIYLVKSIFCNATHSEQNLAEKEMEDPSFRAK